MNSNETSKDNFSKSLDGNKKFVTLSPHGRQNKCSAVPQRSHGGMVRKEG
tara:strand:- start:82 stop:231 length:150 start_codon:yes stop_codon:yes gene_type:complete